MASRLTSSRRPLQPKDPSVRPSSAPMPAAEPKGKRRCVTAACIPCRKRKSKCDAGLPNCSTCIAVYKTECSYDPGVAEIARQNDSSTGVKRDSAAVQEPNFAEQFVQLLISLPESEAFDALYQLRASGDVVATTELLRKKRIMSEGNEPQTIESEHMHVQGNATLEQKCRYGFTSGLGLVPGDDDYILTRTQEPPTSRLWTDVTTDGDLVYHLIKLYFTWSNHFYPIVSEEEFYTDFRTGRTKACSAILVNAMCSYGSVFTSNPSVRDESNHKWTAGNRFFERARHLLFEDETTPQLPTVQALQIMSMREACNGRVSSGFRYAGWALNMAIELGMHLEGWKSGAQEDGMRRRSFWAMFNCDTAWSICSGRVAMLPRAAIEIEKPKRTAHVTEWQLYDDEHRNAESKVLYSCCEDEMLYQQSSLTEILSELLVIYYAPRERLSSRKILDMYSRFQTWHKRLPSSMRLSEKSPPNVFMLHMWYWSCVNHLFRPIVRMKLVGSSIQPRQVCIDMAIEISKAMDLYRQHYPMDTVNLLWCHVLLTAGLTHVFDLPSRGQSKSTFTAANSRAIKDTAQCLRDFHTISSVHRFGVRGIQIICSLVEKYGLYLPEEVLKEMSPILCMRKDAQSTATPVISEPNQGQGAPKSAAADLVTAPTVALDPASNATPPTTQTITTNIPSPNLRQEGSSAVIPPSLHNDPQPRYKPSYQVQAMTSWPEPPFDQAPQFPTSLFFTPVDGTIGLPLYHNNPSQSHMDLHVMLGAVDWGEQLRQDGFELSDVWGNDPMAGANLNIIGRSHHMGDQLSAQAYRGPPQQGYAVGEVTFVNGAWP
ncbi:uncharacterized protein PV09_03870 [Verruconis gallopava]|uniref:Zn(2)-C6 fungal-type domain-containing protein n=1 Tax=Verruconis gallopava TaxID=253628 RepID=A0A0D2B215_9PEZI|nr:uncharacterized protein PV09_03870 [Verruconis gallopava]KIW05354.1 hypothetical protein PV09_03870 [Verruconis gallopava]